MAKASPIQGNFSGGEFSPLLYGRVDSDRYATGLALCRNWIPTTQGGLVRRPGSTFVAEAKAPTKKCRLIPFEFSTEQAYVMEFGDGTVRFFKDNGQIEKGGSPYELPDPARLDPLVPYLEGDLFEVKYTQSADVLYVVHPSYIPAKFLREADDNWGYQYLDLKDGPYLNANVTDEMPIAKVFTLTPGAATGSTSLTAGPEKTVSNAVTSSGLIKLTITGHGYITGDRVYVYGVGGTTEANATWIVDKVDDNNVVLRGSAFVNAYTSGGNSRPGIFKASDTGKSIRVLETGVWGWAKITAFTSSSVVTVEIKSTFTNTSAKSTWRMGIYGPGNYPSCITFHEDRLFLGGSPNYPQRIDGSCVGDYENFQPTDSAGTVTSALALGFTLNSSDVNVVRWLTSDEKGLLVGTVGGEWVVRPSSQTETLSSTNISAKKATSYGSADVQALQVGKSSLFIQRAGRKVRELTYFYDVDGFQAPDISVLAEHITQGGIVQMAQQKEPQSIVWMVRNDGVLLGLTYERSIDGLKVGMHQHQIAGDSDQVGTPAVVESVAVIPSADGTRDEIWISVKRWGPSGTTRYIEYFNKLFGDEDRIEEAKFLDCSLSYDVPKVITAIATGASTIVDSATHGFNPGDVIRFTEIVGMTELNEKSYTILSVNTNDFTIDLDSTGFTTYIAGGIARKKITTVSGLIHLEDEEVGILADGMVQASKVVSSGSITLDTPASLVTVGLLYNSDAQQLRLEAGAQDGTSLGKTRRIHRMGILLHNTLGIKVGQSFDDLTRLIFRQGGDLPGVQTDLFSGILSQEVEFDYDFSNQFCIRADQPLPATILALMPQIHTQDRG